MHLETRTLETLFSSSIVLIRSFEWPSMILIASSPYILESFELLTRISEIENQFKSSQVFNKLSSCNYTYLEYFLLNFIQDKNHPFTSYTHTHTHIPLKIPPSKQSSNLRFERISC